MDLPLPKVVPDVEAGGPLVTAMRGMNALQKARLENLYYGPNIQSEINNRNALTNRTNTMTPLEAKELQLKNDYYVPNITSEMAHRNAQTNNINTMTPLEAEKMRQFNQMYIPATQAQIGLDRANTNKINTLTPEQFKQLQSENNWADRINQSKVDEAKALAEWRKTGGSGQSVTGKDLSGLNREIQRALPQLPNEDPSKYQERVDEVKNAQLRGLPFLPSTGEKTPELSFEAKQYRNSILNRNIPKPAQNQLLQLNELSDSIRNLDIQSISKFAGPSGKARLLSAKARMAINPGDSSIDPEARKFLTAQEQTIAIMDKMRKAWGTSVVPEYVYQTVGQLSNPNSAIWKDPKQVLLSYKETAKNIAESRQNIMDKYLGGIAEGNAEITEQENNYLPDVSYGDERQKSAAEGGSQKAPTPSGTVRMKSPSGVPWNISSDPAKVSAALKAGFTKVKE